MPTWDGLYIGTNGTLEEISDKAVVSVVTTGTAVFSIGTTWSVGITERFTARFLFFDVDRFPLLVTVTENASRNNVPNKTLLVGTFVCAVLGTLRSRFCVPDTVSDVPEIIWNILPNNIRHIFLISDL